MKILNLTQHSATLEQIAAGVVEPADKHLVQALITFDNLPDANELKAKAAALAQMAAYDRFDTVMIGGAPFFMAPLEKALRERNIKILYAFSKRESVDELQTDGSVKKIQVFRHAGFVEVPSDDADRPLSSAHHTRGVPKQNKQGFVNGSRMLTGGST